MSGAVPALRQWPWKRSVLIPRRNIRNHNPQFSRSIIYNVITVELTGHSSCSLPYAASIKFWLVNDCLFFAGHMESAVYSLSLYSHWLTLATDVGAVIVLYCWSAPRRTATHGAVFFLKWLQFAFLSQDYCESFLLYSAAQKSGKLNDTELSHELNLIPWRVRAWDAVCSLVFVGTYRRYSYPSIPPSIHHRPPHKHKKNSHITSILS